MAQSDRNRLQSAAILAGKIALAALVLYLLWRSGLLDFSQLATLLNAPQLLLPALGLLLATNIFVSLRWHILLRAQGLTVGYWHCFRVTYVSTIASLLLPGMVGGDFARVGLGLSFRDARLHALAVSVVMDRVAGLLGLLLVGMAASIAFWLSLMQGNGEVLGRIQQMMLGVATFFALILLVIVTLMLMASRGSPWLQRKGWAGDKVIFRTLADMMDALSSYRQSPTALLYAVFLSVCVHALVFSALTLIAVAMGVAGTNPWKIAVAGVLASVVNTLPLTPGGIGVGEAAFAQILLWLQGPAAVVLPYATVFLAFRMAVVGTSLPALIFIPTLKRQGSA